MSESRGGIQGYVVLEVVDEETGRVLRCSRHRNKITDAGLELLRDRWAGIGTRPSHLAVGTGNGPTQNGQTALFGEILRKPIDRRDKVPSGVIFQSLILTSEANGGNLREAGTVLESGLLLARAEVDPFIAKTAAIRVTVSHVFTFARL